MQAALDPGPHGRLERFGDWEPLRPQCLSGGVAGRRPFFSGSHVDARMALVRNAINHIRRHWDDYPLFMSDLREYMSASARPADEDDRPTARVERLFASVKEWSDGRSPTTRSDYSALRLYTSDAGYEQMFKTINLAFRDDAFVNQERALRAAVFLVELLNIDLFNYRAAYADADEFEGCVYRGMTLTADELRELSLLARASIDQRYLAVPLAMVSASADRSRALAFALETAIDHTDRAPVLWKIDISGLSRARLERYRTAFPQSVVTSLCAVPVAGLSDYPDEQEVLLRGPFFQVVHVYAEPAPAAGCPLTVIEAVMINANRDHPSSAALGESASHEARHLFRVLVGAERAELCARRAEEHGLLADATAYRARAPEQQALLE